MAITSRRAAGVRGRLGHVASALAAGLVVLLAVAAYGRHRPDALAAVPSRACRGKLRHHVPPERR